METSKKLSGGPVAIYSEDTIGIGAYGKVCRARWGQLPCAAKLLHDTLFQYNDPGALNVTSRFLQECEFLSTIRHPNIVQYLATTTDAKSQRPVLLMELMDGSLTSFLEQAMNPLPLSTQLDVCCDVALALAYLHANDIIHRDLSSNNVLLIGNGIKSKVTDFGMSKLVDANPRMTPLTQCPGTLAYMPPEALTTPPHYSGKLDCFSHGVLTIQIATRQFPAPGRANRFVEDRNYPTERVLVQYPETVRRKNDIDLVQPDHPLLNIALHCLNDRDTERPSSTELCGRLAALKDQQWYSQSKEFAKDSTTSVQRILQELEFKESALRRARADIQRIKEELEREKQESKKETKSTEQFFEQMFEDYRTRFQNEDLKRKELEEKLLLTQQRLSECTEQQLRVNHNLQSDHGGGDASSLHKSCPNVVYNGGPQIPSKIPPPPNPFSVEAISNLFKTSLTQVPAQLNPTPVKPHPVPVQPRPVPVQLQPVPVQPRLVPEQPHPVAAWPHQAPVPPHPVSHTQSSPSRVQLTWRQGNKAPSVVRSLYGSAVVSDKNAYFSPDSDCILQYTLPENKWTVVYPRCKYLCFAMAIVGNRLTTIGGSTNIHSTNATTNVLQSLSTNWLGAGKKWKELPSSMPTKRMCPVAATTEKYLVVAGGGASINDDKLAVVEVMNMETMEWFVASSLPQAVRYPQMTLNGDMLFLCNDNSSTFYCSLNELLIKSCRPNSTSTSDSSPVWTRGANIPVHLGPGLTTLRGQVLAIGGNTACGVSTGDVHCYDRATDSWSMIGHIPTPRSRVLAVVLPGDQVVVVGGVYGETCFTTEIGQAGIPTDCSHKI